MLSYKFEAIGTFWTIDSPETLLNTQKEKLAQEIKEFFEEFDKTYSRFRSDSLVAQIAKKEGEYIFPQSGKEIFSIYKKMYRLTNGAFTPLIGNVLDAAGYDPQYSFKIKKMQSPDEWERVFTYNHPKLTVRSPAIFDFGGVGKGYAIDEIAEILRSFKIHSFTADAGGDIYIESKTPERIGLEHPEKSNQVIGVVEINKQSICASAGNKRRWGNFHHIINPFSLESPKHILATWVIADKAIIADTLATALFFSNPEIFMNEFQFEYLILFPDYSFSISKHFPGEIYYND